MRVWGLPGCEGCLTRCGGQHKQPVTQMQASCLGVFTCAVSFCHGRAGPWYTPQQPGLSRVCCLCTSLHLSSLTWPYRARIILTPGALSWIRSSTDDRPDRLARSHLFSTTTSAARSWSKQAGAATQQQEGG